MGKTGSAFFSGYSGAACFAPSSTSRSRCRRSIAASADTHIHTHRTSNTTERRVFALRCCLVRGASTAVACVSTKDTRTKEGRCGDEGDGLRSLQMKTWKWQDRSGGANRRRNSACRCACCAVLPNRGATGFCGRAWAGTGTRKLRRTHRQERRETLSTLFFLCPRPAGALFFCKHTRTAVLHEWAKYPRGVVNGHTGLEGRSTSVRWEHAERQQSILFTFAEEDAEASPSSAAATARAQLEPILVMRERESKRNNPKRLSAALSPPWMRCERTEVVVCEAGGVQLVSFLQTTRAFSVWIFQTSVIVHPCDWPRDAGGIPGRTQGRTEKNAL